jgi:very-short-patch-repair endonuclease
LNRDRAKDMRHDPVLTEKLFWTHLRNRQLGGFKFRRQVPIGPYIADFVCAERMLIIELDGRLHQGRKDYDAQRDEYLIRLGYRVWRFSNAEASADLPTILQSILHLLCSPSP